MTQVFLLQTWHEAKAKCNACLTCKTHVIFRAGGAPLPLAPADSQPAPAQLASATSAPAPAAAKLGMAMTECPLCRRSVPMATADRHVDSCMRQHSAIEAAASRKRSAPSQGGHASSCVSEQGHDRALPNRICGYPRDEQLNVPLLLIESVC